MLNDAVMSCVVAMCASRATRLTLGFTIDKCLQWNIAPLRLPSGPYWHIRNTIKHKTKDEASVTVFYGMTSTTVSIAFDPCDQYERFCMLVSNFGRLRIENPRVFLEKGTLCRRLVWYSDPSMPPVYTEEDHRDPVLYCSKVVWDK